MDFYGTVTCEKAPEGNSEEQSVRCLKFVAMTSCSLGHENRETDGENFLDAAVRREKVLPTEDISPSLTHTHTHTHTH